MGLFGISGVSLENSADESFIGKVCLHPIIDEHVHPGRTVTIGYIADLLQRHLLFTVIWNEELSGWVKGVFIDGSDMNGRLQLIGRHPNNFQADIRLLPSIGSRYPH